MKIKKDLIIRNIADEWVVVPMGERLLEMSGMIILNESGAFIFNLMQDDITKEEILAAMLEEYDIDEETAVTELDSFIEDMEGACLLET